MFEIASVRRAHCVGFCVMSWSDVSRALAGDVMKFPLERKHCDLEKHSRLFVISPENHAQFTWYRNIISPVCNARKNDFIAFDVTGWSLDHEKFNKTWQSVFTVMFAKPIVLSARSQFPWHSRTYSCIRCQEFNMHPEWISFKKLYQQCSAI